MNACPSAFAWDDHEIHGTPFPAAVARHVDTCPRCRSAAERRQASRQLFAARIAAPLRRRLATASPRRRSTLWPVRWMLAAAAAAAGLFLTVRPRPADPGAYLGAKGNVAVEVAGRRSGRVFPVDADTLAEAGDELQFTVRAGADWPYVLVGSVDGTGRFSPFYPATLECRSVALPPGGRPFEPPIVLDGAPGPERIVIVLSGTPLAVRDVAVWAESAASRPGAPAPQITGPSPVLVRWLTVRKGSEAR
jgi:hypothetical protein